MQASLSDLLAEGLEHGRHVVDARGQRLQIGLHLAGLDGDGKGWHVALRFSVFALVPIIRRSVPGGANLSAVWVSVQTGKQR